MNTILDQIVATKKQEVAEAKHKVPVFELGRSRLFQRETISLRSSLQKGSGVIAEIKRKSPSRGMINKVVDVEQLAAGYAAAGVSGISVLTDKEHFGGSIDDLVSVRSVVSCPVLRKEFIIDEYQVVESKSIGADAILLLGSVLSKSEMSDLVAMAHDLSLEVLAEAHNESELEKCLASMPDMVGINNRDLHDFSVTLDVSRKLAPLIPGSMCKVSESGIHLAADVQELRGFGYNGFLIGQAFMMHESPAAAAREFILQLEDKQEKSVSA